MSFTDKQVQALHRNVAERNIRTRAIGGKELAYIEGWYAISAANRIFGFDGWDRETLEARCVLNREGRGSCVAVYTARVRVVVRSGDRTVVRDGHGTGEGKGNYVAEAHDLALKAAETDATKRALVTFGKAFGLALYANGRGRKEARLVAITAVATTQDAIDAGPSNEEDGRVAASGPVFASAGSERDGEQDALPSPKQPSDQGFICSPGSSDGPSVPAAEPRVAEGAGQGRLVTAGDAGELPNRDAATRLGQNVRPELSLTPPAVEARAQDLSTARTGRIDKSVLTLGEPRRVRDKDHLRYVAQQPCLLCSARPADAHHLRFAQPRALGRKVGDEFTVPLCRTHHRDLHHSGNEVAWWHDMGIDAVEVAKQLWEETKASRQNAINGHR